MENVKKYVLVDPRFSQPTIQQRALNALDTQISNILQSDEPDDIKVNKYVSALKMHKSYSAEPKEDIDHTDRLEKDILESVPANQSHKAKRILKRFKSQKESTLTKDGQLVYRQETIPKSDIIELINDVLSSKAKHPPPGWEAFASSLKEANVPEDIINNKNRWSFISNKKKGKTAKRKSWLQY
jgi:hypothetical protein